MPAEQRVGRKGFLCLSLASYLQCSIWTGASCGRRGSGAIPRDLAPILERLSLDGDGWVETVRDFGVSLPPCPERPDRLAAKVAAAGQRWFVGLRRSREVLPDERDALADVLRNLGAGDLN